MIIFCNIYQKSVDGVFQAVYLTLILNLFVFKIAIQIFQTVLRSITNKVPMR